jgi:AGZA family xanthine/uracil permease-like MFS transporter
MISKLDRYFRISELETNLRTEVIAGFSTFLGLAEVFVVNPAILSQAGINKSAVLFATVISAGVCTLFMGFWANLPFVVGPGLEMNGFFAFSVVGTLGLTWQQGLGTVFWSGVLCILLTWLPVRQKIIDSIPAGLKMSIAVTIGVFVVLLGLRLSKTIGFNDGLPDFAAWNFGLLLSSGAIVMYVGLISSIVLGLKRLKITGGMLVAIIASAIACKMLGIVAKAPETLSAEMFSALMQLNIFAPLTDPRCLSVVLIFFILDFYGGIGKFIGLTASTNLQSGGKVHNIEKALYVDGIGTVLGAFLGTSSLTTYVESAVGIATGGRTGITAIVCGVLMLCTLSLTPLLGLIPVEATAGILVYVGWLLFPKEKLPPGVFDKCVAAMMAPVAVLTYSLDKPLLVGFWAYALRPLFARPRTERVNVYLLVAALLLTGTTAVQFLWRHAGVGEAHR